PQRQRGGYWPRHPGAGAHAHFRAVSSGRQLADQGRWWHWARALDRQADRGDAWWPHLGRIDTREGLDLPNRASHARRISEDWPMTSASPICRSKREHRTDVRFMRPLSRGLRLWVTG